MKRWLVAFLFFTLFTSNTIAYDYQVLDLLIAKKLDINSKSYLGWARVLNDQEKRKEYNLDDLSHDEIASLTAELKELSKRNISTFEGKLK